MRMWILTFLLLASAKSISGCPTPPPSPIYYYEIPGKGRYSYMSIIIKMIMINELDPCKEVYVTKDPEGRALGSGPSGCKREQIWIEKCRRCVNVIYERPYVIYANPNVIYG